MFKICSSFGFLPRQEVLSIPENSSSQTTHLPKVMDVGIKGPFQIVFSFLSLVEWIALAQVNKSFQALIRKNNYEVLINFSLEQGLLEWPLAKKAGLIALRKLTATHLRQNKNFPPKELSAMQEKIQKLKHLLGFAYHQRLQHPVTIKIPRRMFMKEKVVVPFDWDWIMKLPDSEKSLFTTLQLRKFRERSNQNLQSYENRIYTELRDLLDKMPQLERLSLNIDISPDFFRNLMNFLQTAPHLKQLDLSDGNRLNANSGDVRLTSQSLESLNLSFSQLTQRVLRQFLQIPSLQELYLMSIELQRFDAATFFQDLSFPNLRKLYISNTDHFTLRDIASILERAPHLAELLLVFNVYLIDFSDESILVHFNKISFPNDTILRFQGVRNFNYSFFQKALELCNNVPNLYIEIEGAKNYLSPDDLRNLRNLPKDNWKRLCILMPPDKPISYQSANDAFIQNLLWGATNLRELVLGSFDIIATSEAFSVPTMPKLELLTFRGQKSEDVLIELLKRNPNITTLDLRMTCYSDQKVRKKPKPYNEKLLQQLISLKSLKTIDLSYGTLPKRFLPVLLRSTRSSLRKIILYHEKLSSSYFRGLSPADFELLEVEGNWKSKKEFISRFINSSN